MVCVSLSPATDITVTVNVATMDGTAGAVTPSLPLSLYLSPFFPTPTSTWLSFPAVSGQDYVGVNMSVMFSAGSTMECVPLSINNDNSVESDETFTVVLTSSQADVTVMDDMLTITILADPQDSKWCHPYPVC